MPKSDLAESTRKVGSVLTLAAIMKAVWSLGPWASGFSDRKKISRPLWAQRGSTPPSRETCTRGPGPA